MSAFFQGDAGIAPTSIQLLLLSLVLAYLFGQMFAWVYVITHSGVSYSRSFVVSLIVLPVLISLVLMVMANNLVTAFGLIAVFAVIRFRNALRDTLDTCYVLSVIILGTGCGTQKFATSVVGAFALAGLLITDAVKPVRS